MLFFAGSRVGGFSQRTEQRPPSNVRTNFGEVKTGRCLLPKYALLIFTVVLLYNSVVVVCRNTSKTQWCSYTEKGVVTKTANQ